MTAEIIQGDCVEVLRTMDADSVQCVVTSPPYWGLRDYGVDGMIGLEPTLDEFIGKMVEVFREVRRVLRPDGCLWLNLGDSYASSPPGNTKTGVEKWSTSGLHGHTSTKYAATLDASVSQKRNTLVGSGLKPKDLCGVPWRVALALQADGWWLRSDIIWHKPNPMPESCTDRPTKAHEYVFLMTKSARYFYDAEAVKEGNSVGSIERFGIDAQKGQTRQWRTSDNKRDGRHDGTKSNEGFREYVPSGRNLRDVWTIPTQSFKKAHFATFPQKLVEPCLKAGTSAKGCCPECGTPWVRVVERPSPPESVFTATAKPSDGYVYATSSPSVAKVGCGQALQDWRNANPSRTIGWKGGCVCHWKEFDEEYGEPIRLTPIPCAVLDPFAGSGTVGVVCKQLGLDFIGIELNPEYCEMARKRIANPKPEPEIPDVPGQMGLFE